MTEQIKLTEYSHGAGCGCKISPALLHEILTDSKQIFSDPNLIVGNENKDDAAVVDLGDGKVVISTTDFFMPIVDDPFDFGRIAAVNAISDVFAMGGKPIVAISILGWPISKISVEAAKEVVEGARSVCHELGISLAGGHSIDSPEPIFGLAVTGLASKENIKKNSGAKVGASLFLTKPIGVGILSTAKKKGLVDASDYKNAINSMLIPNRLGEEFGKLKGVQALTDVTGFGLLGHLTEVCEASSVSAIIDFSQIPFFPNLDKYIESKCVPGGTTRNWDSYGHHVKGVSDKEKTFLCDPQTSGGLLVVVAEEYVEDFIRDFSTGNTISKIGTIVPQSDFLVEVTIS